jgi:alkylhydroperoxidase family enzyme
VGFIEPVPEEQVTGAVAEAYAADLAEDGYVSNVSRAFSHRPEVVAAWVALNTAVTKDMDRRRYELVTIAAARRMRSSYCMLAHGNVLAGKFYDAERVRAIALDHSTAGLDEVDVAVMDLADKVAHPGRRRRAPRPGPLGRRDLRRGRRCSDALLLHEGRRRARLPAGRGLRRC